MRKIKRILLIQPPVTLFNLDEITPNMPLGLAYIAAVLENEEYNVKILDALIEGWHNVNRLSSGMLQIGLGFKELKSRIMDFDPQVVGISSMFTAQWHNAAMAAEAVKAVNEKIVVVVGGAHPTAVPEAAIQDKCVDFVVIGEGETAFLNLVRAVENNSGFDRIKGLAFRNSAGPVINYEKSYIDDLDSLPFPARHLLPLEKYFEVKLSHGGKRRKERFSSIVTSRGCPAKCIFCSAYKMWGRKYRARSPENVIEEIKTLKSNFGIEELSIEDDNFTFDRARTQEICDRMTAERLDMIWDTPNGVAAYTLDEDLIRRMKESGCYKISFAIESGNQDFLSTVIKKPLNLKTVPRLINYARSIGLGVNVFFVVGVPGETEKTLRDTFQFAKKLGIYDPFISIANPYPGTPMLELCVEKKYLVEDFNFLNLSIKRYNIETPQLPIVKFKKILKRELLKMSCYKVLDIIKNPYRISNKVKFFMAGILSWLRMGK